jgi:4-diphosphocytidyl-2-C-methyl-D-erythritol kinase
MRLCLHAPAKVNLGLRVVGRRPDGYHLLETTFHALELHDTLWLDDAAALGLAVIGEAGGLPVPAGDDNLVLRAARAFFAAAAMEARGQFRLEKRIPAGGGLGGGSSDAAAALLLLQHRHGKPLSDATLAATAVQLGADVAFFLRGGTQHGCGVGERLTAVPDPPVLHFVLVVPPFGTSTAAVFKNYAAELTHAPPFANVGKTNLGSPKGLWSPSELSTSRWHNDLEASAEQLYPELVRLRAAITGAGYASISMSGSGSSLFLTVSDADAARAARDVIRGLTTPAVRVLLTRSADGIVASRTPITVQTPLQGDRNYGE